jgi:hypothetical protein
MLAHPRHLILPMVFPEGPCKPGFYFGLIWKLILTTDFPVSLSGRTDFDYGCFVMGLTAGVTDRQGMLASLRLLISPLIYSDVCVSSFSDFFYYRSLFIPFHG